MSRHHLIAQTQIRKTLQPLRLQGFEQIQVKSALGELGEHDVQPSDRTFESDKPESLVLQGIAMVNNNLTANLTSEWQNEDLYQHIFLIMRMNFKRIDIYWHVW